jgi:hypothetical protein
MKKVIESRKIIQDFSEYIIYMQRITRQQKQTSEHFVLFLMLKSNIFI